MGVGVHPRGELILQVTLHILFSIGRLLLFSIGGMLFFSIGGMLLPNPFLFFLTLGREREREGNN